MQIRTKLTFQFTLLVSTILLLTFLIIYLFAEQYTLNDFNKRLKQKAITSAILLLKVDQVDSTLLKTIDINKKDILFQENISIFNDLGKEIYTNNDTIHFETSFDLLKKIEERGEITFEHYPFLGVGILFKDKTKHHLILAEAIDIDGQNRLHDLKKMLFMISFVVIAIVSWAGWFYSNKALAPIKKIMEDVQSISSINLDKRLHESKNPDELGKLIIIFNSLLARIDNAFKLQKTFVTNVSHELKNPLTKITSQLEVTLLNDRTTKEYKDITQSVLDDIKELNQLSTSLLDLASLSQPQVTVAKNKVRIDEILWEVREAIQSLNSKYKVDIHTIAMPSNEEDLYLNANPYLLKTALQNLIENACKFSEDQLATVSLICAKGELEIRIFDNGPGIDPRELQNIFQPFYRSKNTSKVKGHGIGLSLSQRIIDLHNGAIEIDSMLGQGTQIVVMFNTANS